MREREKETNVHTNISTLDTEAKKNKTVNCAELITISNTVFKVR